MLQIWKMNPEHPKPIKRVERFLHKMKKSFLNNLKLKKRNISGIRNVPYHPNISISSDPIQNMLKKNIVIRLETDSAPAPKCFISQQGYGCVYLLFNASVVVLDEYVFFLVLATSRFLCFCSICSSSSCFIRQKDSSTCFF